MKTLSKFINESLVKSDHINEGIINIKDYRRLLKTHITAFPNDRKELKQIIVDTIKKEGNICDLNFIDTSNITDMNYLFYNLTDFDGDISMWDVSNVVMMSGMFEYCGFNGDISNWDVSNVKDMSHMFENSDFNRNILKWDVSNVEDMEHMFYTSKFNGDISKWDVSNVKDMSHMFEYSKFNGDISNWNVSKVEKFDNIFCTSPLQKIYGEDTIIKNGHFVKR